MGRVRVRGGSAELPPYFGMFESFHEVKFAWESAPQKYLAAAMPASSRRVSLLPRSSPKKEGGRGRGERRKEKTLYDCF